MTGVPDSEDVSWTSVSSDGLVAGASSETVSDGAGSDAAGSPAGASGSGRSLGLRGLGGRRLDVGGR